MREYETVFITQPNLSEPQHKQLIEKLTSIVEKHNGTLFFARDMGKKSLAYPIKKQVKGAYTCLDYAAGGDSVSDIERILKLDENVLRFLSVVKNEDIDVKARTAEIAQKGEEQAAATAAAEETTVKEIEENGDISDISSNGF